MWLIFKKTMSASLFLKLYPKWIFEKMSKSYLRPQSFFLSHRSFVPIQGCQKRQDDK